MSGRPRVLVMDDELSMRELLEIVLGNDGYEVRTAPDVASARDLLMKESFDAVITDLRIGTERNAGMQLLTWTGEHARSTPVIMITAHGSVESAIDAMKRGAADYILKPFKNDEIRLLVRRAIEQRDLRRENQALRNDQS
ncbi:MAG: response regulator, partial [Candidatus Hydrogenedentota bacterium]